MVSRAMQTCKIIIVFIAIMLYSDHAWAFLNVVELTAANVIYVNGSTGSNNNDGKTEATAVKTIGHAYTLANVDAKSNLIFLKDTGAPYELTESVTYAETTDTIDAPWLVGYKDTPNDNGMAEISCDTVLSSAMFAFNAASKYTVFMNLSISGTNTTKPFFSGGYSHYVLNCHIDINDTGITSGVTIYANGSWLRAYGTFPVLVAFNSYIESTNSFGQTLDAGSILSDCVVKGGRYSNQGGSFFNSCTFIDPSYAVNTYRSTSAYPVFSNCIFYVSDLTYGVFRDTYHMLMNNTVIYYHGSSSLPPFVSGTNKEITRFKIDSFSYAGVDHIDINPQFANPSSWDYSVGKQMSGTAEQGWVGNEQPNCKDHGALQRKAKSSYVTFQ